VPQNVVARKLNPCALSWGFTFFFKPCVSAGRAARNWMRMDGAQHTHRNVSIKSKFEMMTRSSTHHRARAPHSISRGTAAPRSAALPLTTAPDKLILPPRLFSHDSRNHVVTRAQSVRVHRQVGFSPGPSSFPPPSRQNENVTFCAWSEA